MKKVITILTFLLVTQFALAQISGCINCDKYMISDTAINIDTLMGYKNDKNKKIVNIYKISLKQYDSLHHMNRVLVWYSLENDNLNKNNIINVIKEKIKEKYYYMGVGTYAPYEIIYFKDNDIFSYHRFAFRPCYRFNGGYYDQLKWGEYAYFFSNNKKENKTDRYGASCCKTYFRYRDNLYLKGKKIYDTQRIRAVYNIKVGLTSFRIKDHKMYNLRITHVYGQPLRQYLRHPKHPMKCKW